MISDEKGLRIGLVSDVHFFHKRTRSPRMLAAIRRLFPDNDETGELDIIAITGDWTDHLVSLDDPDVYFAQEAAIYLMRLCAKRDIDLIVLEGTKSHDRNQNIMFDKLNKILELGCNVIYRDTLCIEYLEKHGINILFLPDEWSPNAEVTLQQAKDLIHSRGLAKVDFVFMHGGFTYQLPGIPSPALHDAVAWSELVEYAVFSGHIHTHSRYLNVMSVGSLERLGHGEEENKGVVYMTYANGREADYVRKINHDARIYRTLDVQGMEINDVLQIIDSEGPWEPGSAIRLLFDPEDPKMAIMEAVKAIYGDIEFTEKVNGKKLKTMHRGTAFVQQKYVATPITRANVSSLLEKRWSDRGTDSATIEEHLDLVRGLL
ncbi:metallo-dependent phosphatase-like superfamily protein [Serratia phage Moabite]|uniref:Metallo-dependent phosphatase-like superfamily protein n=1 Tax=Serratia phage Moabite TaxID=2587814 RepID=A0A4Y5TNX8_9CAUD|nr:SbcD-like subunit of palindrome specific endonuclease [Serratia phage Moabite]QDB71077.1 metallo-dependent phosphatase-like superfamily protein [Serratia phage Moabite]